jgi:methanogenic corrinoid protein MtbC1
VPVERYAVAVVPPGVEEVPVNVADPHAHVRLALHAALVGGDPGTAYGLVRELMDEGVSFDAVLFDYLGAVQREVGTRWHQADYRIAEEHAASSTTETVVGLLAGSFDTDAEAPHVVVACAEGDTHSLPARMISAYLTSLGWRVTFLGASVPGADLGSFLADEQPQALALSCSLASNLRGARASIEASHAAGVPVVAGGRAFGYNDERASALGADAWAADPRDLDELLRTWDPDPVAAEAAVFDSGDLDVLEQLRYPAVAAALDAMPPAETSLDAGLLRADVNLLWDILAASVLVADPAVVAEFVSWHDALASGSGRVIATRDLVAAFRDQLPDEAVVAHTYLDLGLEIADSQQIS